MKDLKIDLIDILHNEDKKQEAVWMLNKIGYKTGYKSVNFYRYLYACGNGHEQHSKTIQFGNNAKTFRKSNFKEITIAELRSMVKPMKEYLIPSRNYKYILTDAREALEPHAKDWIEIPVGAEVLSTDGDGNGLIFWKDGFNLVVGSDDHWDKIHCSFSSFCSEYPSCMVLWVRPQQPEALPFIDDNPQSLCEQYAEIEQVRQVVKVKSGSDSDHALDAMSFGLMGAGAAQAIAGVDATLAERQSTYGNFEDVAFVTENIMAVLGSVRVNGLNELPNTHRMALYMIASKMARIVNGDFNHFDSWHDIGGYSKLIEKLINGE